MFNAHISFIEAMIKKGYFDETAFLLKAGAIYDMDVWKHLKQRTGRYGELYSDFLKMFFLLGLGCGDEAKVAEFLKTDRDFMFTVLSDLSQHLFQNSYGDKKKYAVDGTLPMPFGGVQSKLTDLYKYLLGTTKMAQVLGDKEGLIVPNSGNGNGRYYSDDEDADIKNQINNNISDEVTNLMQDYAMLQQTRMMFFDNFSNFRKFEFGVRGTGVCYHGTKDTSAFDCSDLSKLKDNLMTLYGCKRLYVPKEFVARAELRLRNNIRAQKKNDRYYYRQEEEVYCAKNKVFHPTIFGMNGFTFYVDTSKLSTQVVDDKGNKVNEASDSKKVRITVFPTIQTPRMTKMTTSFAGKLHDFLRKDADEPCTKVKIGFGYTITETNGGWSKNLKVLDDIQALLPQPFEVDLVEISDATLLDGAKMIEVTVDEEEV